MKLRWQLLFKILLLALLIALPVFGPRLYDLDKDVLEHLLPLFRFASVLLALNVALSLFGALYRRRKGLSGRNEDAILLGLRNVYYIILVFVVLGGVISLYGIDFRSLFTSLSIIAAAIAIVTRDFIVEVIAGLIMSFSGQLSVGDYISVGTTKGRVITLTLTKCVLLNEDEDMIHIPNTKIFGGELVNYTLRMQRRISIEFEVALAAMQSVDDFEQKLIDALADFKDVVVPNSYSLRVVELHKDYAEFKFRYTLLDRSFEIERDIRRRTSRTVINYIHAASTKFELKKFDKSN